MQANNQEILALIPARGGSKGIPKKNLALLGGEPLLSYTIRAARASRLITRIIVSTDDEEIAEVARRCGAEVPFLRPPYLAGDHSNMDDAFQHIIAQLQSEGYQPQHLLHLIPTSPFRTPSFLDMMIDKLLCGHLTAETVKAIPQGKSYYAIDQHSGAAKQVTLDQSGSLYRCYGIFFGINLFEATKGHYMHCISDRIMLIDIDTPEDLMLAETVIQEKLFDFQLPKMFAVTSVA